MKWNRTRRTVEQGLVTLIQKHGGPSHTRAGSKPVASSLFGGGEGKTLLERASKAPSRRIFSHTSTALFRGDYLFSAKSSGELICVEANTGKQVWESSEVTDLKDGASIHLTPNGDSVLLYTDRGELIRAQLTSRGYNEISRVTVLEPTFPFGGRKVAWSPPAYANPHIFARNGKELICASLAVGP